MSMVQIIGLDVSHQTVKDCVMNKELLQKRIEDLKRGIEVGAAELNKLMGRYDESLMHLAYIEDKEHQAAQVGLQLSDEVHV